MASSSKVCAARRLSGSQHEQRVKQNLKHGSTDVRRLPAISRTGIRRRALRRDAHRKRVAHEEAVKDVCHIFTRAHPAFDTKGFP